MAEETYEDAALILRRTKYYSGVFEHEITEALHHPRQILNTHPNIGKTQNFNIIVQSRPQRRLLCLLGYKMNRNLFIPE